jgi:uncharacterized protein (DUF427 family)
MVEQRGQVRTAPSHKRVRVFLGGECIVDTDDALYVWENPHYPQYYLPASDFAAGALAPTERTERSPSRGTARYVTVKGGDVEVAAAGWSYDDSPMEEIRGRVRLEWDAMDAWFEEDEEVFVHPRSPTTRVQILPSSRHVVVSLDGVVLADTNRPTFLYETHLPRRTYMPKLDVRMDLLVATDSSSRCPYKGIASYWSANVNGHVYDDLAWSYPTPFPESEGIAGLVCFYDEFVDVSVDGTPQERPRTPFSRRPN